MNTPTRMKAILLPGLSALLAVSLVACGDTTPATGEAPAATNEPPKVTLPVRVELLLPADPGVDEPAPVTLTVTAERASFARATLVVVSSGVVALSTAQAPLSWELPPFQDSREYATEVVVSGRGRGEIVATFTAFEADDSELWVLADHVQIVAAESGIVSGRSGFLLLEEQALAADLAAGVPDVSEYAKRLESLRGGGADEEITVEEP